METVYSVVVLLWPVKGVITSQPLKAETIRATCLYKITDPLKSCTLHDNQWRPL